jgi:hypothetical protein
MNAQQERNSFVCWDLRPDRDTAIENLASHKGLYLSKLLHPLHLSSIRSSYRSIDKARCSGGGCQCF